jgi:hypothetical protein
MIPAFSYSTLMNYAASLILHMKNEGSEKLTSSRAELGFDLYGICYHGMCYFWEKCFSTHLAQPHLEWKKKKVNQFIMNLEGGQSYHPLKHKRNNVVIN